MAIQDFFYTSSDGLLKLNCLSPSKKFYYRVKNAIELNKSAFGCEIAFFEMSGELLYHKKGVYAHELHSKKEIEYNRSLMEKGTENLNYMSKSLELVKWSKCKCP